MTDPLGFFLLLGIGLLGISVGTIGLKRGKVVAVFNVQRDEQRGKFWYGIVFQFGLGAACLVLAVIKALE